jgi:mutator protein MutT
MTRIPVVAAVILKGSRVFLGRRPDHKRHGGMWEFPGGKIDEGETEADAVTRELLEEFGVGTTSVGSVVYECRDPGSPFSVRARIPDDDVPSPL